MIKADQIREILESELKSKDLFLVDLLVRPGNKISVFIDSMKGVTLEECIGISRFIENSLDREKEDFELEVSSPGLDKPLKQPVQFIKNIGRMLDVVRKDGVKITGKLMGISDSGITVEKEVVVKDEKGRKKKSQVTVEIKQEDIKTAKIIISL